MIPLPSTPLLIAAGVAVALLVGAGGGWRARGTIAERDIAELVAKQATSLALASEAARALEHARSKAIEGVAHDADKRTAAARRDAAAAAGVAGRLREHIARLVSGASADPATASPGTPASGPGLVLADLFGRADGRAGELAAFADAASSAGLACAAAYEALRTTP